MTDVTDVGREPLVPPTAAPQEKGLIRESRGCRQKELFDSSLPVGQTISQKGQISGKSRIGRNWVVGRGIERIVNRNAFPRAERVIGPNDGIAAAVGEHQIVAGNKGTKGIQGILLDPVE